MGFYMRLRLTCDISQEQLDSGYDLTLLTVHSRYVKWILELELPIISFSIYWEESEDGEPHLYATVELLKESEVAIDKQFLDELRLGGKEDG